MDDRLKKALDFSNYQLTLSIKKKTLNEKMNAKLTFGYEGGIFFIDRSLIVFVQMLIDKNRIENIPLLDINNNPVIIKDLQVFQQEIFDRYFSVVYEYHEAYEEIKKARSIEKLV